MILTRDWTTDFDLLVAGLLPRYAGEPYAFARFADGEEAVMRGWAHDARSDGWKWGYWSDAQVDWETCEKDQLPWMLSESLTCNDPGWYVGLTAQEHHDRSSQWLHGHIDEFAGAPDCRRTFAEIFFMGGNYDRFQRLAMWDCFSYARGGDLFPPSTPQLASLHLIDSHVNYLIEHARSPIIVAAGPPGKVVIHRYWTTCPPEKRQVIVDVGSAVDERFRGRRTRKYHHPGNPLRNWKPAWQATR